MLFQTHQILLAIQAHVCFLQVTFRYQPVSDVNTLENLSFEAQPGQMVALVGRSGSLLGEINSKIPGISWSSNLSTFYDLVG